MSASAEGPRALLAGLKIVDFSAQLPRPYGTVLRAGLGADVIKVEPPAGDMLRSFPFEMARVVNRNKRSIVVDLKNPASRDVLNDLGFDGMHIDRLKASGAFDPRPRGDHP